MLDLIEPRRSGLVVSVLAVGGEQRSGLDRVAQRGAGAVGLDRVDVLWLQAGVCQGLADHPLLGGAVGGGQAVGGAVLVDGGALEHGEDRVAVALGVGEALQSEDADPLGPADAVGCLGEGLRAAVGGEAALAGELDEDAGGGEHGDAARQGQRALAAAQRLRGQVHRDQGGGAGGVDGDRRALEAEGIGDAAGDDAASVIAPAAGRR